MRRGTQRRNNNKNNKYYAYVHKYALVLVVLYVVTMETVLHSVLSEHSCCVFVSILFVGWPSHLLHSHICDLLGSD